MQMPQKEKKKKHGLIWTVLTEILKVYLALYGEPIVPNQAGYMWWNDRLNCSVVNSVVCVCRMTDVFVCLFVSLYIVLSLPLWEWHWFDLRSLTYIVFCMILSLVSDYRIIPNRHSLPETRTPIWQQNYHTSWRANYPCPVAEWLERRAEWHVCPCGAGSKPVTV